MLLRGVSIQQPQQLPHPFQLQRRAEAAGEELPGPNQRPQVPIGDGAVFQVAFQQRLVAQGRRLLDLRPGQAKIHAAGAQLLLQLAQQLLPVGPGQIHFVDEEKHRHLIPLQQPPEGQGVGLYPVGAADHQHRAVQNRQGALRLRRKIHMPRSIQQGQLPVLRFQPGLLGENGDPPLPFQGVAVQIRVPMIHPPQRPPLPAAIKHPLRKGRLPRIHMG